MMPAPGVPEVIGSVAAATNASCIVISSSAPHGLKDGDEVKVDGVEGNAAADGAFYVKASDQSATTFALYSDKKLTQPVAGTGDYQKGGTIYRPLDDYAIVVGINRYPAFTSLQGPEADALRFRNWLVSPTGGMVAMNHVRTIFSSDYSDPDPDDISTWQPALDDLKLAFRKYSDQAYDNEKNKGSSRVGRRLYIFLSGHGITPAKAASNFLDDAALLSAGASQTAPGEHILGHSWAGWFHNAAAFDEIILLMDCCRDLKNNVIPVPCTLLPLINDRRDEVRLFYAVATELDSKSWEQDFGSPPERHGVFSYALMQALQSETLSDSEGRLTGSLVAQYLDDQVPKLRGDQKPKIMFDSLRDIVLVQKRRSFKPNLRVKFDPSCAGQEVQLFLGNNLSFPFSSHVANGEDWKLRVERGIHKLTIPGGKPTFFQLDGSQEVMDVQFP